VIRKNGELLAVGGGRSTKGNRVNNKGKKTADKVNRGEETLYLLGSQRPPALDHYESESTESSTGQKGETRNRKKSEEGGGKKYDPASPKGASVIRERRGRRAERGKEDENSRSESWPGGGQWLGRESVCFMTL